MIRPLDKILDSIEVSRLSELIEAVDHVKLSKFLFGLIEKRYDHKRRYAVLNMTTKKLRELALELDKLKHNTGGSK